MRKYSCPRCDSILIVVEETCLFYNVDPDSGVLDNYEVSDDIGGYTIDCSNCDYQSNEPIDWGYGDTGKLIPREDN